MTYASIASGPGSNASSVQQSFNTPSNVKNSASGHLDTKQSRPPPKRSPSPAHVPKTESPEDNVYVLTLLTDKEHHIRMTNLRNSYFPKKINKLAAHLTLFHALPGSKLEDAIIPTLEITAAETSEFRVHAAKPFRMKKGIAISIPKHEGASKCQDIHKRLQDEWLPQKFLSEQDAGGCRVHYTICNKVDDDTVVDKYLQEVQSSFKGDWGTVTGLGLWRYDRGFWRWERGFGFKQGA
ncbi:hypothetical protein MBLNU230_g7205t1 [Neophaeotheca triangularis]